MSMQSPGTPPERRGLGYPLATFAVLVVMAAGAVLGGIVLPQYLNVNPVQSALPLQQAPAPTPGPAPVPSTPLPPAGTVRVGSEESVIISVVKQVRPSVVNINTEAQVSTPFGLFPEKGAGSGVIVRPDGYILTNNHVVQGANDIKVTLIGGRTLTGRVIGTDPYADLAVIRVSTQDALPAAQLGSSGNLQVGQLAIAIGNPFGLGSTVTTGVVSALNRNIELPNVMVENLIQTSAAINPGNSGGALVDSSGRVIGINTAIIPNAQGIGFAIPSDVARVEMDQLIATGRVVRPWIGVIYGGQIDPEIARANNLVADHGILVRQVEKDAPAARAGVQPGDIIVAVNGERIEGWNDFVREIVSKKVGETVTLTVIRDTTRRTIPVVLAPRPAGMR